jgi:very-short-patch-repair endonuclease
MTSPATINRSKPAVMRLKRLLESAPRAWSRAELMEASSDHTVNAAVRAGVAVRAAPGLFVAAEHLTHPRARLDVASKWAAPAGAVGGAAALWVHGLIASPPNRVTIIAPHAFKRAPLPFTAVRRFTIDIAHRSVGGIITVPPLDAVIQAWVEFDPAQRIGATLDAMRAGRLDAQRVHQRLDEYPRVRERSALSMLLAEFAGGAKSFLEYRARTQVFNGPQFREFVWQAPLNVRGTRYVLDMLHRSARLAIELDGRAFHGDNESRLRDIQRDAELATVGIATLRLTYADIMGRPEWCRRTVLLALRARAGRSASIEGPEQGESPRTQVLSA